jgi:hypothetical protein
MTHQSAREALTLVENYLQALCPSRNVPRILGEFLEGYSLHHQLLSASYSVGGPSAGFALAITPCRCCSVTGPQRFQHYRGALDQGAARGSQGVGDHRRPSQKAEKVLQYLPACTCRAVQVRASDWKPTGWKAGYHGVRSFSALVPRFFSSTTCGGGWRVLRLRLVPIARRVCGRNVGLRRRTRVAGGGAALPGGRGNPPRIGTVCLCVENGGTVYGSQEGFPAAANTVQRQEDCAEKRNNGNGGLRRVRSAWPAVFSIRASRALICID